MLSLSLIMEKVDYIKIELNGYPIKFKQSSFDVNFIEADINDMVKTGKNEIIYAIDFWQHDGVHFALFNPLATESLKNCLYYDISIENCYLKGNFIVNENMSLSKPNKQLRVDSQLSKEGYPFFMGSTSFVGEIEWNGEEQLAFELKGNYLVAKIEINGNAIPVVLDNMADITSALKIGNNKVTVVIKSSMRNLFGPHHYNQETDLTSTSPYAFTFRGQWNDKETFPNMFTNKYISMPFGIEKILLIKHK